MPLHPSKRQAKVVGFVLPAMAGIGGRAAWNHDLVGVAVAVVVFLAAWTFLSLWAERGAR